MATESYADDIVSVPRAAIRWPLELPLPPGFRPEEPSTWPRLAGRLEYVGGEIRAADGAIWRRTDVEPRTGGFRRAPPVLAVEIAGRDETEPVLREKARWYLDHGVARVWLVLPDTREVVALTADGESRHSDRDRLSGGPELPGLEIEVARLFRQLS